MAAMTRREVHARAGAFDAAAAAYERGRPGWPDAALEAIVRRLGLSRESAVLDLAAGTGKLTRMLVGRFASVVAVEPLDGMRAVLERDTPGARAAAGTAEAIPLEDGTVDAVFVAEAFHWFDAARAVAEMERVLRPGGGVAVLYNRRDWAAQDAAWQRESHAAFEAHRLPPDDVDPLETGAWQAALSARFGVLTEEEFAYAQHFDAGAIEVMYASFSAIAGLPPERRDAALAAQRDILDRHGIRAAVLDYRTVVVTGRTG